MPTTPKTCPHCGLAAHLPMPWCRGVPLDVLRETIQSRPEQPGKPLKKIHLVKFG